jgi:Uma2 family endonuclease
MVTTPIAPRLDEIEINLELETLDDVQVPSLEEFLLAPAENMEWVDGELVKKTGVTLTHGQVQLNLGTEWKIYARSSGQGGRAWTEAPCRTLNRGRRPDVAYATPAFMSQIGTADSAPQSFPLIAEIVSPTDPAEMIFSKAQEYLQSGCLEVWLVMPENRYIFIVTTDKRLWFAAGETVSTQMVLPGFAIAVDDLLA